MECYLMAILMVIVIWACIHFPLLSGSNENRYADFFVRRRIKELNHRDGSQSYKVKINLLFGCPLLWYTEYADCGYYQWECHFSTKEEALAYINECEKRKHDRYNGKVLSTKTVY